MAEKFEPGEWPRDPHGYVFLGRAFDRVGSATFKAEWTNREKTVSLPVLLPEGMPQRGSADLLARALLHVHVPEFKARLSRMAAQQRAAAVTKAQNASRSTGTGPGASMGPFPDQAEVAQAERTLQLTDALTADEWRTARELNKKSFELAKPEWDRAVTVRETIIAGFERGSLNAFTREKAGGEMKPMPPEWWNTDRAFDRFIHGDVDTRNPFSVWRGAAGMSWIFISQSSLDAVIKEIVKATSSKAAEISDDPDCHLMVSLPGRKQQMVFRAMNEIWKDGRVPRILTVAEIQEKINPIVRRLGDLGGASTDNIRRALGQKKN